jgi:PIN domain nuclease of toxin-antitoxin system
VGGAQLTAILLDTHVWAWSLIDYPHLSQRTREAFASADDIIVSAISFFEIAQKVRIGKWPEMTSYVDKLLHLAESQQAHVISLEPEDCLMAGTMEWPHRDPFDRLLAASAIRRRIPIASADPAFDAGLTRIW